MNGILQTTKEELKQFLKDNSFPAYRADQIHQWIYKHRVTDWQQMTNLPADLHHFLAENFFLYQARLEQKQISNDGTVKVLLRWPDGTQTESVLIVEDQRRTACLSSQVGCPVGCVFCASGLTGLERSLTTAEIVEQIMWLQANLAENERISNVVIMGMGEPLANYENTLEAIRIINADWGPAIGVRHITLSTIGLPKQIRRLAQEGFEVWVAPGQEPAQVFKWRQAILRYGGKGLLMTMWVPSRQSNRLKILRLIRNIGPIYSQASINRCSDGKNPVNADVK